MVWATMWMVGIEVLSQITTNYYYYYYYSSQALIGYLETARRYNSEPSQHKQMIRVWGYSSYGRVLALKG